MVGYITKRGEFILLQFTPQAGHDRDAAGHDHPEGAGRGSTAGERREVQVFP